MKPIEIIDLFAGPGGLGEGFSQLRVKGKPVFKIAISIEKEKYAHATLTLRSFVRQFNKIPIEYYQYLKLEISKEKLFEIYPDQYRKAKQEAWCAELGSEDFSHAEVCKRIRSQLNAPSNSIVIGGPPCQAYSLIGRSKMGKRADFDQDPRHTLYQEYLKIIAEFKPAMFVMENVKGIISSKLDDEYVFDRILEDLKKPVLILKPNRVRFKSNETYTVYSLVSDSTPNSLTRKDFTIRSENYGIPQRRHRVILVAVRNDLVGRPSILNKTQELYTTSSAIGDLPKLRSGLSKKSDSAKSWVSEIEKGIPDSIVMKDLERGGAYLKGNAAPQIHSDWFFDKTLEGVIDHETRSHISEDLLRYYFISYFAKENNYSPKLEHFPKALLPKHKNVSRAIKNKSLFNDRFRVQLNDQPATTVTSHISKDGHYFIHYDSSQCRSLTVREAARLQTFPDNYKFEGPRTSQYQQVGNAVPPLLAYSISKIAYEFLNMNFNTKD